MHVNSAAWLLHFHGVALHHVSSTTSGRPGLRGRLSLRGR
jgi:hypothetical protein